MSYADMLKELKIEGGQDPQDQSREAQDLAIQTAREREVGILVISEQNRDLQKKYNN